MKILTIRFGSYYKTYDYLSRNSEHIELAAGGTLDLVTSTRPATRINIVNVQTVDSLPRHVTSYLDIYKDRTCVSRSIPAATWRKLRSASAAPAPVAKPVTAPVKKSTKKTTKKAKTFEIDPIHDDIVTIINKVIANNN